MKDFLKNINVRMVLIILLAFLFGWQLGHKDVQIKLMNYKPSVSITNKEL